MRFFIKFVIEKLDPASVKLQNVGMAERRVGFGFAEHSVKAVIDIFLQFARFYFHNFEGIEISIDSIAHFMHVGKSARSNASKILEICREALY